MPKLIWIIIGICVRITCAHESAHGTPQILPGGGKNLGSFYQYHVPLVGQESSHMQSTVPYPGHYMSGWDSHGVLLWLIPLGLLLVLAPLVLLPLLLKTLLIPAGLLALLLPLLLMGGMMMMMMMMGGGMMMMPMRNQPTTVTTARTLRQVVLEDGAQILESAYSAIKNGNCGDNTVCKLRGVMKAVKQFKKKLDSKTEGSAAVVKPSGGGNGSSGNGKTMTDDVEGYEGGDVRTHKNQNEKRLTLQFKSGTDTVYV